VSESHPEFDSWLSARCPDLPLAGARAALALVAEGKTAAFVGRYRRDETGGLDAAAVRRAAEARDLFAKILSRQSIMLESIERHATLSDALRERILSTYDLDALEDLYHPYRAQKKNRALAAREAGLQPLADWIWDTAHGTETPHEGQTLELWAFTFRNEEKGIADGKAAVEGARDILVERLAGDPELRASVRRAYFEQGTLRATKTDKAKPHSKFEAYFAFQEKIAVLREPAGAHRYLALRRGQAENELQIAVAGPADDPEFEARLVAAFESHACTVPEAPGAEVLRHAGRIAFKNDVRTAIENEVHRVLKDAADAAVAKAFAESVRRPLLEPAFGARPVLGVDPSPRAGCRLAAIGATGGVLATETLPFQSDEEKAAARDAIVRFARERAAEAVAVGNGTGGREVEVLARRALREAGLDLPVALVSETGAGAWAASDAAKAELPELDPGLRTAVSIARRLQDPLAELVKIEPRSLGSGLYHHDVAHAVLHRALDAVVEDVVCHVGPNLQSAPRALLARVPGLGPSPAASLAEEREKRGGFRSRRQLLEVPRLGPQEFEQAAGFLRLPGGEHPLDATLVHPERYATLEALAERAGKTVGDLLGDPGAALVREAGPELEMGPLAREDTAAELARAGRDPRGPFVPFAFSDDLRRIEDLKPGLTCPGIVSNVTSFGAFVDVGVNQDGLVHISQLPRGPAGEPLHPGDRVEVRVLKIDLEKKQISLTMRPRPERRPPARPARAAGQVARRPERRPPAQPAEAAAPGSAPPPTPRRPPAPRPKPAGRPPARERPKDAPSGRAAERPRPERTDEARRPPARPQAERRPPETRRPAFNNPFAVLAGLKVPPKDEKKK
jgi:uncharacterized protein